jgi:hypothetical protein
VPSLISLSRKPLSDDKVRRKETKPDVSSTSEQHFKSSRSSD